MGAAPAARPSMRDVLRDTYALHDLSEVALSPAGTRVAWEESYHPGRDPSVTHVRSTIAIGGARIAFPDAQADLTQPVWSPDGSRIAFLASPQNGSPALYTAGPDARDLRRVATLAGNVQDPQWSPDGKFIAVLYVTHPHRKTGALAAGARAGALTVLTPPDVYVYEYAWAPDSKRLAYTYAHGSGDNNWWIDPAKLGLFGWSYGGYMAMWAETQTSRFRAIVAGAGIVN